MAFYSFDTSSILNGRRDLLPPAVFPTVWARIEAMINAGSVRAVDVVRDELGRRDDDACAWAKFQNNLFVPLETPIQARTAEVLAAHPKLMGVGGGRNGADPFVIGLAMTLLGGTVVTEEKPTGNTARPKIPDVCDAMGVPWMNLIQFIGAQGWQF